jgi:plasmid stabilization system protein ParE
VPTRIWLAESAVGDLEGIRDWYVSQSAPQVGERVVREILTCLDQLAAFPESGRVVPEFDQPWLRELVRPPFRIVYRLEPDRVRIVRVWRAERLMAGLDLATGAHAADESRTAADSFRQSAARSTLKRTEW